MSWKNIKIRSMGYYLSVCSFVWFPPSYLTVQQHYNRRDIAQSQNVVLTHFREKHHSVTLYRLKSFNFVKPDTNITLHFVTTIQYIFLISYNYKDEWIIESSIIIIINHQFMHFCIIKVDGITRGNQVSWNAPRISSLFFHAAGGR